jgi:hypothetical protein
MASRMIKVKQTTIPINQEIRVWMKTARERSSTGRLAIRRSSVKRPVLVK